MLRLRLLFYAVVAIFLLVTFSLSRLWAGRPDSARSEGVARTPVLIELFTSEGCSDCPPADALLEKLDRSQPVNGANLIVLSEHVDYWDGTGWKDPYSAHQYSQRQSAYSDQFHLESVYTPQMVVDGQIEFVGSDERRAVRAIENVTGYEKIPVRLSAVRLDPGDALSLHVSTGQLQSGGPASANVMLAIADERDESHVGGGENGGKTLRHIAVVLSLTKVGTVDQSSEFSKDIRLNVAGTRRNLRIIAFVQESTAGRVVGVGSTRLSN